jgi:hypothetical protein
MQTYFIQLASRALPGQDEAYRQWYTDVHVPEVLAVPGFKRFVARYRLVNDDPQPAYLAVWEVESGDPQATLADLFARGARMTISPALDRDFLQTEILLPCP